jgi:hypothetical protein
MFTVKQNVRHDVDADTSKSYNLNTWQRSSGVEQRTHKPLVAGSNPAAATNKHKSSLTDQGITQIPQAYPHVNSKQGISLEQAVKGFLNLG